MTCRHCSSNDGDIVLDLGRQPSAEVFPDADTDHRCDEQHPLRMWLCRACRLAQLMEDPGTVEEQSVVVEPQAMTAQGEDTLAFAEEQGFLRTGARVVELGSPHGHPLTERLKARGLHPLAADDPESADGAEGADGVDVVLDVYGLLHEPDQERALDARLARLAPGGVLVLQLHTLASVISTGQFSELRHGHFAYWSLPALDAALRRRGWGVHRARRFAYDSGTLAVIATADPRPDKETSDLVSAERSIGVTEAASLRPLQRAADLTSETLRSWLETERIAGRRVVGYGAAGRSVPVLCHARIDASLLGVVADAATGKHGRRLPGTDIVIVPPGDLESLRPDRVLLFLPDLLEEVRRALPHVEASGAVWVILDPAPTVVDT